MPLDERPLREVIVPTWDILTSRAPGGASISYGDLVEELIGERIRFPDQAVRAYPGLSLRVLCWDGSTTTVCARS